MEPRKVTPFPSQIVSKYPPGNIPSIFRVGKEITSVIDGIFPGGYLLTVRLGNGVTLRGSMLTSD